MSIASAIRIIEFYPSCRVDLINHLHRREVNRKEMASKAAQVALAWFKVSQRAEDAMAFSIKGLNQL